MMSPIARYPEVCRDMCGVVLHLIGFRGVEGRLTRRLVVPAPRCENHVSHGTEGADLQFLERPRGVLVLARKSHAPTKVRKLRRRIGRYIERAVSRRTGTGLSFTANFGPRRTGVVIASALARGAARRVSSEAVGDRCSLTAHRRAQAAIPLDRVRSLAHTGASGRGESLMLKQEDLARRLDAEESALGSLRAEGARIAEEIAAKIARIGLLRELLGESPAESGLGGESSPGTGALKVGSRVARAHAYLREAGESRHMKDILVGIGDTDSKDKRDALSSQINRYVKAGRLFARDAAKGPRHFRALPDEEEDPEETPT